MVSKTSVRNAAPSGASVPVQILLRKDIVMNGVGCRDWNKFSDKFSPSTPFKLV